MKPLRTQRLILRGWEERDREIFHHLNADPDVMRYFPFRRSREEADAMMDKLNGEIARDGFSFSAIEVAETGACVGFCGIRKVSGVPGLVDNSVEIGWRLARNTWGKGYATEAAAEWLRFGFETVELPEIFSFAVSNNTASLAVMERIGMHPDAAGTFDHPTVPDDQPQLKRHVLYRLTRDDWQTKAKPKT